MSSRTKPFFFALICLIIVPSWADAPSRISAQSSQTQGAILFMNYCSGCHSLSYVSWPRLIRDLQLTAQGSLPLTSSMTISLPDLSHTWPQIAMAPQDASQWFGKTPPDLSLVHRQRGGEWIRQYLLGFYPDAKQPFGVNNLQFPQTRMPHILETLETDISAADFSVIVSDIVDFLDYAADPSATERRKIGGFVVGFFLILLGLFRLRTN